MTKAGVWVTRGVSFESPTSWMYRPRFSLIQYQVIEIKRLTDGQVFKPKIVFFFIRFCGLKANSAILI